MNTNLNTEHEHEHEPKFLEKTVLCLRISLFVYEHHLFFPKNINFCELCEKDTRFQKGGVIFANSEKQTHVSQG